MSDTTSYGPDSATATAASSPRDPEASLGTLPTDSDLRRRMLEVITGGLAGEKIVQGFLIGVALGLVVGALCCCWMPCFGPSCRERRRLDEALERGGQRPTELRDMLPPWIGRQTRRRESRPGADGPAGGDGGEGQAAAAGYGGGGGGGRTGGERHQGWQTQPMKTRRPPLDDERR